MKKSKQNNNYNDKSELSSVRSKLSTETLTSDDETQTSFEYLKENTEEFFGGYPNIFDSDLKKFFERIASQEKKNIDYNLLSKKFLLPSGDVLNFFNEYNDLYNFCTDALLENTNNNKIRLQKTNFLKDLRTDSMFTKIF